MMAPCKDCEDRHIACHANCEKYMVWKQDMDAVKDRAIKCRINEKMLNDRRNKAIIKMKHGKRNNACTSI